MDNNVNSYEMQKAANYISVQDRLVRVGTIGIMFGAAAICIGFFTNIPTAKLIILAIGILLLAEGILILTMPSPDQVLITSSSFAAFFLWIIIVHAIHSHHLWWFITGVYLLSVAIKTFEIYGKYMNISAQEPTPESIKSMRLIIKNIAARDETAFEDIIEMKYKDYNWKILLGKHTAVFIRGIRGRAFIRNREDVVFVLQPDKNDSQFVSLSIEMTEDQPAKMSKEHYERYLVWKGIPSG